MKRISVSTALLVSTIVLVAVSNQVIGRAFAEGASAANTDKTFTWPKSSAWPHLQCRYSIYVIAAEVGRQCRAGRDLDFQAELERTVARYEAVIRAGDSYFTTEHLKNFKAMQIDGPDPIKCNEVALNVYEAFHKKGTNRLRIAVDSQLTPPKGGWSKAPSCVYDVVPAVPLEHVKASQ
jgi:hypothetical protein